MSRTRRNVPEHIRQDARTAEARWGATPGASDKWLSRTRRWANRVLQGRDGSISSDVHGACAKSPKGYNTWDEVGTGSKRQAKHEAAAALRRRVKDEIQDQFRQDQE